MQEQMTEKGRFATLHASRYLQQLCKHFAHKVDVQFDAQSGQMMLFSGPATLEATDAESIVILKADSEAGLERSRHVIDSHLARFSFHEAFTTMVWVRSED